MGFVVILDRYFAIAPTFGDMDISLSLSITNIRVRSDPRLFKPSNEVKESFSTTIRKVGSLTGALDKLKSGDKLWVGGPFGNGWPVNLMQGKNILDFRKHRRPDFYDLLTERK